jgi:hypothetical protein
MQKGSKSKNNAVSIGVAFRPITRAKLDLIAAGMDRPVGWVVRDAVSSYLELGHEMEEYRARFPRLAAALDQAIADAGGDQDEIYGSEMPEPSSALASPAIHLVRPSSQVAAPSSQPELPMIQDDSIESGDSSGARGLLG